MKFQLRCLLLVVVVSCCIGNLQSSDEKLLWKIQQTLVSKKYVDLTHEFEPGIPRWPGFPDETRKTIYWYEKRPDTMGAGFFSEVFTHVGQWGTHVDPPAHFIKGLRTVDQIDLKEMILPLAIIDVHGEAERNPEYTLTVERLQKNGKAITDKFQAALLWRCGPIGQNAGRTRQKWRTKMQKARPTIPAGACRR